MSELEGPTIQIDGVFFDYIKCADTLLVLRYTKTGMYSGLEFPRYKDLAMRQTVSWRKLQGSWFARGLIVDWSDHSHPQLKGIQYDALIQDNMIGYAIRFIPLVYFFEMEQHCYYCFLWTTLPNPVDRIAHKDADCLWMARRCLIPYGSKYFVVTWGEICLRLAFGQKNSKNKWCHCARPSLGGGRRCNDYNSETFRRNPVGPHPARQSWPVTGNESCVASDDRAAKRRRSRATNITWPDSRMR